MDNRQIILSIGAANSNDFYQLLTKTIQNFQLVLHNSNDFYQLVTQPRLDRNPAVRRREVSPQGHTRGLHTQYHRNTHVFPLIQKSIRAKCSKLKC